MPCNAPAVHFGRGIGGAAIAAFGMKEKAVREGRRARCSRLCGSGEDEIGCVDERAADAGYCVGRMRPRDIFRACDYMG